MTESEKLFEEILRDPKIEPKKIPEGSSRTPDYEIKLNNFKTYWEIKELEENDKEKGIIDQLASDNPEIYSIDSKRVRHSIKSAFRQFQEYNVTDSPCIIVLYDSRKFAVKDILFYQYIESAMFGIVEYQEKLDGSIIEVKRHLGLLTNHKEFISAIAVMHKETKEIVFYHNPNANINIQSYTILKHFKYQFQFIKTPIGLEWKPV
jgi:hypothetical protein